MLARELNNRNRLISTTQHEKSKVLATIESKLSSVATGLSLLNFHTEASAVEEAIVVARELLSC